MKIKLISIQLFILFNFDAFAQDLYNRPPVIQSLVTKAHKSLKDELTECQWREKGNYPTYNLMLLLDYRLIDWLVEEKVKADPGGTIRIIDFGSGLFAWGTNIAQHILKRHMNSGLKFEIFGLTGEKAYEEEKLKKLQKENSSDFVSLVLMQQTEIESIGNLFEDNTIDLIVSRWTMLHLIDPMGTLNQLHGLLKMNGLLLFDGFDLRVLNSTSMGENRKLFELLYRSKVKMISLDFFINRSYNNYLLQKISLDPIIFAVKYAEEKDLVDLKSENRVGNITRYQYIEKFEYFSPKNYNIYLEFYIGMAREEYIKTSGTFIYFGDPDLIKFILDNKLFGSGTVTYVKNKYLENNPSELNLKIDDIENEYIKNYGDIITAAINWFWPGSKIPSKPYDVFSFEIEERDINRVSLHRSLAKKLVKTTYKDIKIEENVSCEIDPFSDIRFEGCHSENGCSKDSYWPPIFLDRLLIPTLEYLLKSKQIDSFELLKNGDIRIGRKFNF